MAKPTKAHRPRGDCYRQPTGIQTNAMSLALIYMLDDIFVSGYIF